MLEPHPPHHTPNTWRDFFIHIATIAVGLLIAVGIEQTVEAIHHRHQRHALLEQMHEEAERNLPFENDSIARLIAQMSYLKELRATLLSAVPSGDTVLVHGIVPRGGSMLHVSPSRAAWAAAKTGGVPDLLPAGQAQLYARRDFNAEVEEASENTMYETLRGFVGQMDRSGFHYGDPSQQRITLAQRGDILLALDHFVMKMEELTVRLAIERGADEAVAANEISLDAMLPYQSRSVDKVHPASTIAGNVFGSTSSLVYKPSAAQPAMH